MKTSDIPFNMASKFNEQLLEIPESLDEMEKGVEFILNKLEDESDEMQKALLHSLAGHYLRILNKLEEANQHLTLAIEFFKEHKKLDAMLVSILRRAISNTYQRKFTSADRSFNSLLTAIANEESVRFKEYEDQIYFFYAISKLRQKQNSTASDYFNKSLEIRLCGADMKLVGLSKHGIKLAEQ
jgi:phosphate uptake regulator